MLTFDFVCYIPPDNQGPPRRNFFKGDYDAMREVLWKSTWEFDHLESIDDIWNLFSDRLCQIITDFVPQSNSVHSFKKPWMNKNTAEAIDKKRRAWTKLRHCNNTVNCEKYKFHRNQCTNSIRIAKHEYEKNICLNVKDKPKVLWSYIKSKSKTRDKICDLMQEDGELTSYNKEKAEVLNKFFSSVFTRENTENVPEMPDRQFENILDNITITPEEVLKKLFNLNPSKAAGPDGLHCKLLYELRDFLCEPLARFFNRSLQDGEVPDQWRQAHVSPIFKKGDKKQAENYRPVSLTCVVCKVMESIVRDKLMLHMESNNLFSKDQFGFRSGYFCVTQLLHVLEEWSKALDSYEQIDVIYLDFRKAFDTVAHERLANKLHAYGIRGNVLNCINSFLHDRKQKVVINGEESSWSNVLSGIPQGSVLGPALFLVFINDLPPSIKNLVKIFADDTKVYSTVGAICDREQLELQEDLDESSEWSGIWDLGFNAKKCKSLHIGRNNPRHRYYMHESGEQIPIEQVDSEKDLGVTFESTLRFDKHISNCVNKANRMLGLIKRSFSFMDKEMFLPLYKALIRPHLEYATVVWSPFLKKDIFLIENVQRRATKIVRSIRNLSYEERLKHLGLPTLKYRRERNDMIQVYKIMNGIDKLDVNTFFKMSTDTRTRGHNFKITKQQNRTVQRASVFSQRVITPWNALPEKCVNSDSINKFKSSLNDAWKDHPEKFSCV